MKEKRIKDKGIGKKVLLDLLPVTVTFYYYLIILCGNVNQAVQ